MSPEEREAHIRRMMAHGQREQDRLRRGNVEFDAACRKFWDFMRTARICEQSERASRTERELDELERTGRAKPF